MDISNIKNLLLIGDLHFKTEMSYADYVKDGRKSEKKEVLETILELSKDCEGVVLLGDNFNNRNNPSEVIREFVSFIESFGDKEMFIIAGNHSKTGDGRSAIDFMREVNKPNWHIVTNSIEKIGNLVFLPYFYKTEIGVNTNDKLRNHILKKLPEGDYLFGHHAIAGYEGDYYNEMALPLNKLKDKYKSIFMGHIHKPDQVDNFYLAGSVFTSEAGEGPKFVYTLDVKNNKLKSHMLPNRLIFKFDNPTIKELSAIPADSIVKISIVPGGLTKEMQDLFISKRLNVSVIEKSVSTRAKLADNEELIDLNINELLEMYAKQKKVSVKELLEGFLLVK